MKKILASMLLCTMLFGIIPFAMTPVDAHTEAAPMRIDLIAGKQYDAGDVLVWGDANYLYIKINNTGGWKITQLHIEVATTPDGIPQTKSGNPVPGQFEYRYAYDPAVSEIPTIRIALQGQEIGAGSLSIAVHAVMIKTCGPFFMAEQTAWAWGPGFRGANWGMYFI